METNSPPEEKSPYSRLLHDVGHIRSCVNTYIQLYQDIQPDRHQEYQCFPSLLKWSIFIWVDWGNDQLCLLPPHLHQGPIRLQHWLEAGIWMSLLLFVSFENTKQGQLFGLYQPKKRFRWLRFLTVLFRATQNLEWVVGSHGCLHVTKPSSSRR